MLRMLRFVLSEPDDFRSTVNSIHLPGKYAELFLSSLLMYADCGLIVVRTLLKLFGNTDLTDQLILLTVQC